MSFGFQPTPTWNWAPNGFPTPYPNGFPTPYPNGFPTPYPNGFPTPYPHGFPTPYPHGFPTPYPNGFPTPYPNGFPTPYPNGFPTPYPNGFPTPYPNGFPAPYPTPPATRRPTHPPTPQPTYDYDTEFFVFNDGELLESAHDLFLVYGIDSNVDAFEDGVLRACSGRFLTDREEDAIQVEDDDMRRLWPRIYNGFVQIHQQQGFHDASVNFTRCLVEMADAAVAVAPEEPPNLEWLKWIGIVVGGILALGLFGFGCVVCTVLCAACVDDCGEKAKKRHKKKEKRQQRKDQERERERERERGRERERERESEREREREREREKELERGRERERRAAQDAAAAREIALGARFTSVPPIPLAMATAVDPADDSESTFAKATVVTLV